MNRRTFFIRSQLALFCLVGCDSTPPKDPGNAVVEARVKEGLKLTSLTLIHEGEGRYSGTGTGSNGTKYKVTATQGKNNLTYEALSEDGNSKMTGEASWGGTPGPP